MNYEKKGDPTSRGNLLPALYWLRAQIRTATLFVMGFQVMALAFHGNAGSEYPYGFLNSLPAWESITGEHWFNATRGFEATWAALMAVLHAFVEVLIVALIGYLLSKLIEALIHWATPPGA